MHFNTIQTQPNPNITLKSTIIFSFIVSDSIYKWYMLFKIEINLNQFMWCLCWWQMTVFAIIYYCCRVVAFTLFYLFEIYYKPSSKSNATLKCQIERNVTHAGATHSNAVQKKNANSQPIVTIITIIRTFFFLVFSVIS